MAYTLLLLPPVGRAVTCRFSVTPENHAQLNSHVEWSLAPLLRYGLKLERESILRLAGLLHPSSHLRGRTLLELKSSSHSIADWAESLGMSALRQSLAEASDCPPKNCEWVISTRELAVSADPAETFRTLCSWVAPGGKLVLLAPRLGMGGWFHEIQRRAFGINVNLFSVLWLRQAAIQTGMRVLAYEHPHAISLTAVLHRPRA